MSIGMMGFCARAGAFVRTAVPIATKANRQRSKVRAIISVLPVWQRAALRGLRCGRWSKSLTGRPTAYAALCRSLDRSLFKAEFLPQFHFLVSRFAFTPER